MSTKKKILKTIEEDTEQVELDLPDKIFMELAMKAHKQNITLNALVKKLLCHYITELVPDDEVLEKKEQ